ncbi:MAG TPA: response regulator [Polyangiaceae bacterium]|nr:response regulator [Polyangiaceae bacterium]
MRITLRTKLLLIAGVTAAALLLDLVSSGLIGMSQARDLVDLESRIVPRLALAPRLQADFGQLRQSMQNAVAAQDTGALEATFARRDELLKVISNAEPAISKPDASNLRFAVEEYYSAAIDISRRLIAGETGEAIGQDIEAMQAKQTAVTDTIQRATSLGHNEAASAFATVRRANERGNLYRVVFGATGLALLLFLSVRTSRGLLRAVTDISSGFSRFGKGSFDKPIALQTDDELTDIARAANEMARDLGELNAERDRIEWLQQSLVGLTDQIRGEFTPAEVTQRALDYLAVRTGALVGTFHMVNQQAVFSLTSQYGLAPAGQGEEMGEPWASFSLNQGLAGRAAASSDVIVVSDPPPNYLRVRSSLGAADPQALVLVPLKYLGKSIGLIELALLGPCSPQVTEFLTSMREGLAIALTKAKSREVLKDLLTQAQQQSERLAAQEEELRSNNQELESQQEVLRDANDELEQQRKVLSERNAELEQTRQGLQEKAAELSRMSSYKSQFLANMSHELRTPLNSMLILSHLLAENDGGRLSEKQVEHARTVHSAGQDLLLLINQVLDLAKIEAGRQEVHLEEVDLASIAANARRVFQPLTNEKGLELLVELGADAPATIVTDRQRLERILTNLLGNAIKFTSSGQVGLRIRRPDANVHFARADLDPKACVAFSVSDTGIGIAQDAHERVFAPFEQVDAEPDQRHAGTGLGLAIARESANLIGGELQLSSEPGVGSTFTCFLPEKRGPVSDFVRTPKKPNGQKPLPVASASDLHVLVIEDDPILAEQLVDIIRARSLNVRVATSGQEGLVAAREQQPRGIVLDVKLPDIDGWTVMERLRRDPSTSSIPVHFISAVDTPQRGYALGAIGYLTKPVSRDELVSVVRVLIPPSDTHRPCVLVVEDNTREGLSLMALLAKEGVDLLHVTNATAALAALEKERVGCMILDLGLPDSDGLELLQTLRKRTHLQWPRVVVHTGRALTRRETHELETYAEAVILKDGGSAERLLEEVRLFTRHVREHLPPAPTQKAVLQAASEVSLNGATILVAEDDMRTVYAVSALLRGKGAEVLVADTGVEALNQLAKTPRISAVLMDVMMPEMDGYEAMRQLRANPKFSNLPVIALTAKAMKGERERCIAAGASDYLTKPVDNDLLLVTVANWLKADKRAAT